jgi:hypothetical protein
VTDHATKYRHYVLCPGVLEQGNGQHQDASWVSGKYEALTCAHFIDAQVAANWDIYLSFKCQFLSQGRAEVPQSARGISEQQFHKDE